MELWIYPNTRVNPTRPDTLPAGRVGSGSMRTARDGSGG